MNFQDSLKVVCGLFVFLSFSLQHAQRTEENNIVVDFITVKEGLSHNYVTSVVSDGVNIKWIGTENGITKYNGYDFEYIKPSEDYLELYNENIETLFSDDDSNIWIGTKSGGVSYINVLENKTKSFNHLINIEKNTDLRVISIAQDTQGHIWVGTRKNGVFVIDFKNDKLISHYNYRDYIYTIKRDFNGGMWFTSGNNLYHKPKDANQLKKIGLEGYISDIVVDEHRNKLWASLTGEKDVLFGVDLTSFEKEKFKTGVRSTFSKRLSIDASDRIWIGTWGNGVHRSNADLSSFEKIDLIEKNPEKIEGNYHTILSIYHDTNNVTWLGTASGGVVKLTEANGFENLASTIENNNILENLNVTTIHETEHQFFLGTLFSGVFHGKDLKSLQPLESLSNEKINTFYQHENLLYIGYRNGIQIYDLSLEKIIYENQSFNKVTSLYIKDEDLWVGTQQDGIIVVPQAQFENENDFIQFNKDKDENFFLESNRITSIKESHTGQLWVSSYNGLFRFDEKENDIKHHSELMSGNLPSVIINSLTLKGNYLWLSTPNGLVKLNYKDEELNFEQVIGKKDGLNSDFICGSTFDDNLNLWIATHTEIVNYNDIDKSMIIYDSSNGVATSLFNNNSVFNFNNERIYFGGIDNVTFFNPSSVTKIKSNPEVVFTGLRVKNELIRYTPDNRFLDKELNYASKINLSHKDDFFSIRFVNNDYLGKFNTYFRYKLDGYQNNWIHLQSNNEINFAGLSPGEYTLYVQTSKDEQNWSESKSIDIFIKGSPWKSTLAISIYALLLFSIIAYFVWLNNHRLKLKNKLEISQLDEKKKMELTEAKLNFFTNISHEFRTPLTLIMSPLKELIQRERQNTKAFKHLTHIEKNANRLLDLINQLLDFRKADYGLLKLNVAKGNFVNFAREVHLYFKEAAKKKNINYTFSSENEQIDFPFDRNKMEIVLCNLISNALKYSHAGGDVNIHIKKVNGFCEISVSDSGVGMNAKYLDKIFDRFFQIETADTAKMIGSGIGLTFSKRIIELHHGEIHVKSKPQKGTQFTVSLAMEPSLYDGLLDTSFKKSDDISIYPQPQDQHSNLKLENKPSILIVDDNADILSFITDILSDHYEIIQAENGKEGLQKALSKSPDLIVSDVMMPIMDGIELCKTLKTDLKTSHIPIILLTARTSTVYEIEGLENGADDYVTKPFDANVIKARIATLLENRQKLQSYFLNKIRFEPTPDEIDKSQDRENSFIQKAIQLVEDNLENEEFGIDLMIEELNMSRSSLFRKIKSLTGLSITAFIRSIRLKKAAHLILTDDELNMKEVAFQVGFNTYKYFKNSFKKQYNCLPTDYREKSKKMSNS